MKQVLLFTAIVLSISSAAFSQTAAKPANTEPGIATIKTSDPTPIDLANAAVTAHGGTKLKAMKTLFIKGSLDLNVFNQATPATFATAISGEKYSFIINSALQPLKQVYDGQETYSSMQGFSLPPVTSLGFPLLPKVGTTGYIVTALADPKKK